MEKKRIEFHGFHSIGICRGVLISEKVVGIEKRRRSTSFSVLCDWSSMHVNVSSFMIWWTKDLDFARNCPMIHGYFVGLCYHLGHLLNSECPKLPGGLKASWYENFGRVPQPQAGPVWAVIFMWCKLQLLAWTLWLRTGGILVILTEENGKTQLLELNSLSSKGAIKIGLGTIAFGGFIIGCLKIVAARPWNHVPCYVVPRYGWPCNTHSFSQDLSVSQLLHQRLLFHFYSIAEDCLAFEWL